MSKMSNEAIAEHILHIVHKYDEEWNDTMKQYERAISMCSLQVMAGSEQVQFPEQPAKPPATVLLDRIKATLEHYND
jgi:hypothetical protein